MILRKHQYGFTLLEMLLVMVILSAAILMGVKYTIHRGQNARIDRAVIEIQYILNAAQAFYLANGRWPDQTDEPVILNGDGESELQTKGYLPLGPLRAPYGIDTEENEAKNFASFYYTIVASSGKPKPLRNQTTQFLPQNSFTVAFGQLFPITDPAGRTIADPNTPYYNIIAGRLPFATIADGVLYASVPIPVQNINNAMAMKYAGNYHHGACVPVPVCPKISSASADMKPQLFVVPVSVRGVNDDNSKAVYPLTSFTAYAVPTQGDADSPPPDCYVAGETPSTAPGSDCNVGSGDPGDTKYWRVCMQVVTQKGDVQQTTSDTAVPAWGASATVAAFTRCGMQNEPEGTGFSTFTAGY